MREAICANVTKIFDTRLRLRHFLQNVISRRLLCTVPASLPSVVRPPSLCRLCLLVGIGVRTQKPILGFVSAALFAYICHPIAVRRGNIRSVGVDTRSSLRTLRRAEKRIGSRNLLSYHIVMTGVEVWALAIGLSMDCLAVAVASGVIMERVRWRPMLTMALAFGLFQALNPLIGWLGTNYFRHLIESVDHWIAFAILLFLGGRMVIESFGKEENKHFNPLDTKVILTMALGTSIDALAVGISFVCMGMNEASDLVYPLCVIGFVSFAVTMAGLLFGIKFGGRYARRIKADLWGGIILIAIGVRVLVEHLGGDA